MHRFIACFLSHLRGDIANPPAEVFHRPLIISAPPHKLVLEEETFLNGGGALNFSLKANPAPSSVVWKEVDSGWASHLMLAGMGSILDTVAKDTEDTSNLYLYLYLRYIFGQPVSYQYLQILGRANDKIFLPAARYEQRRSTSQFCFLPSPPPPGEKRLYRLLMP